MPGDGRQWAGSGVEVVLEKLLLLAGAVAEDIGPGDEAELAPIARERVQHASKSLHVPAELGAARLAARLALCVTLIGL